MKHIGLWVALATLVLVVGPAPAAIVLDFGTGLAGTGGTYALLSGGQATGTGIPIGSLTVSGDGAFDGVYLVSGTLSFDTRTGSNFIKINGTVGACQTSTTCDSKNLGITSAIDLLTGTISSFTADGNGLHDASGPDTKNPTLLTALGLPTNLPFGFFGFSLATNSVTVGNSSTVISTDIRNTSVPEPTSILLFGTVLVGVTQLLRRRNA